MPALDTEYQRLCFNGFPDSLNKEFRGGSKFSIGNLNRKDAVLKSIITNENDYIGHGPVIGKIMNRVQGELKKRLKLHRKKLDRKQYSQEDIANIDIVTWVALVKAGAYQVGHNVGSRKHLNGDEFDLRRGEAEAYLRRTMMQSYHKGLDEGMILAEQFHQAYGNKTTP